MGSKIHKVIGYGFSSYYPENPQFDISKYYDEDNEEGRKYDKEGFLNYCKKNDIENLETKLMEANFNNLITYEEEFGLKNVVVFIPPSRLCKDWYRYDDFIDYYDELKNEQNDRYEYILSSLYPFSDLIDLDTGKRIDINDKFDFIDEDQNINQNKYRLKLYDGKFIKENIIPKVPDLLKDYLVYKGIFKNREEVQKLLRPMIYIYWG